MVELHVIILIILNRVEFFIGEVIMMNQVNELIKIESSYSSVGGDKALQGLQEYLNSPHYYNNFFSNNENIATELEVVGESIVSNNDTNPS